ncbi:MAG: hypothetical protein KGD59_11615 [Candidatus Heimdallarchaeota archaeon]|nr:hypothetical protein [Candidatus Heimdallarchaeota archaeon]MBY8995191.1 hypothetical protein [Candidatus Heimdallarchaeota archaeon]
MKRKESDYVAWYILALFDYGMPVSNLSQRQLNELWAKILEAFKKYMPKEDFFVKGKIKEIDMPHLEESFKLAEIESYDSYIDLRRSPLIGFYNRRLIIRLTIGIEDFFELKAHRDDILRDLKFVFEDLKGTKVSVEDAEGIGEKPWEINEIFYYPLIIVRNGVKMIKEEIKASKKLSVDPIFSIPSTTLTYTLPERGQWFSLFSFKEHYIRLSVRSVMVFCDGWIPLEFKQTLINAIYTGGIHEQMRRMRNVQKPLTRQRMRAIDDDILMNLAEIIRDMVKTNIDSARIAEKQRFIGFFIASLSFLISVMAFIISLISIFR